MAGLAGTGKMANEDQRTKKNRGNSPEKRVYYGIQV
jgi:hypothetical protein